MNSATQMAIPKWREMLSTAIAKGMKESKDSITIQLATIEGEYPRVRSCLSRGFVNERRKEDDTSQNDESIISNALLTTTDARAAKAKQILSYKEKGGPVEVNWWIAPTGEQFRIKGRAFVLSPPNHSNTNNSFPGERLVNGARFDWEEERQRIWRKMSPPLKASFIHGATGIPIEQDPKWPDDYPMKLGVEDKEQQKQALEQFALIAIDPLEIDYVNLNEVPNVRTRYIKQNDEWKSQELVP